MASTSRNKQNRLPLGGCRVLDLYNVVAGPTIGAVLARFGADVIKIDGLNPLFEPTMTIFCGIELGRVKRSLFMDLKSPDSQEAFRRLTLIANVIIYNGPEGVLNRLGFGYERLQKIKPGIIVCQVSALGGPMIEPRSHHTGYADTLQASTEIMARYGEDPNDPEEHSNASSVDYPGDYLGSFGVILAILHKAHCGQGTWVKTSLAAAAQAMQSPLIADYVRHQWTEPSGRHSKGSSILNRVYQARDSWGFLGTNTTLMANILRIVEFDKKIIKTAGNLENLIEIQISKKPAGYWESEFQQAGIGAAQLKTMKECRETHLIMDNESAEPSIESSICFIRHEFHPSGRWIDLASTNWIRPKHMTISSCSPAAKYETHSREILHEIGYRENEIKILISKQIVAESWSNTDQYLPL